MSKQPTREETIKVVFAQHTNASGFYFTSDNQAFSLENDAINHGKSLENTEVEFIKNENFKVAKEVKETTEVPTKGIDDARKLYKATFKKDATDEMTIDQIKTAVDEKLAAAENRKALVKTYTELYEKAPAPNWDVAKLNEMILAKQAD